MDQLDLPFETKSLHDAIKPENQETKQESNRHNIVDGHSGCLVIDGQQMDLKKDLGGHGFVILHEEYDNEEQ